jgi:hypothetical protein
VSSYKSKFNLLCGIPLVNALRVTSFPVKWIRWGGAVVGFISAEQAAELVNASVSAYEGKARPSRVFYIREVVPAPVSLRDDAFRFEMPVLRQCQDFKAASHASYSQDPEVLARYQDLRRRAYLQDIQEIPSGRWQ